MCAKKAKEKCHSAINDCLITVKLNKMLEHSAWPTDGLELTPACPACNGENSSKIYSEVIDKLYRAPGEWTFCACKKCKTLYLNPRPSMGTLHLAYKEYYTHSSSLAREEYSRLSFIKRLRRRIVNGYTNSRFGTDSYPQSYFGFFLMMLLPSQRNILEREYRHIPKLSGASSRLLDVGCGNVYFLKKAQECGYEVVGLDTDPVVIANGKMSGIEMVYGDLMAFEGEEDMFDIITMSHVIEHMATPSLALSACFRLLKPGGIIWIETPNIGSFGHSIFKESWRGLEPPRHLVIFNLLSLSALLKIHGFANLAKKNRPDVTYELFKQSHIIKYNSSPKYFGLIFLSLICAFASKLLSCKREYITIIAKKPIKK